jgi:hypothetical protein
LPISFSSLYAGITTATVLPSYTLGSFVLDGQTWGNPGENQAEG